MIIAVLLASGALAMLAWIVFNLSVYAFPFFVGVSAASLAHASGSGLVGAGLIGLAAGALALAVGQAAFAALHSPALRIVTLGIYALPAAVAGYAVTHHVMGWTGSSAVGRVGFATIGALVTAAVACVRLNVAAPGGPGGALGPSRARDMPKATING